MNAINDIAEKYQMPVIYSTHPRSQKFIEKRNFKFHPLVQNLKPFGFMDYNKLQKKLVACGKISYNVAVDYCIYYNRYCFR